jgi:outer membrane receptor protein involved in Fe transport
MDSYFGSTKYLANQHSAFANLLYQNVISDEHKFTLGLNGTFDRYNEDFARLITIQNFSEKGVTDLANAGIFGEYTFHAGDKFSAIAGLRADWFNHVLNDAARFRVSPRMTLKYMPVDEIVIRANGGRGLRYSTPLVDNIGVFSTGKMYEGDFTKHILEDAWTFGGNITYYMPFGASSNTYLSFDYFRTQFALQMVVDYEQAPNMIDFYALDGRQSFTDNYQLDFSVDIIPQILAHLHELKIGSLLVEGGHMLLQSFIDSGLWDEIRIETNNSLCLHEGVPAPQLPHDMKKEKYQCFGSAIEWIKR